MTTALWRNGEPTEYGVEVFTEGECWTLAYYLHKLGGWPVVALGPEQEPKWYDHVVVQLGSGKFLDVNGPNRMAPMLRSWGGGMHVFAEKFTDFYHFQSIVGGDHLYDNPHGRAKLMAERLVKKWELL